MLIRQWLVPSDGGAAGAAAAEMTSSRPSTKYHEIPRDAAEAQGVPLQMQHSAAKFVRWLLRIMVRDGTHWMALQPTPLAFPPPHSPYRRIFMAALIIIIIIIYFITCRHFSLRMISWSVSGFGAWSFGRALASFCMGLMDFIDYFRVTGGTFLRFACSSFLPSHWFGHVMYDYHVCIVQHFCLKMVAEEQLG